MKSEKEEEIAFPKHHTRTIYGARDRSNHTAVRCSGRHRVRAFARTRIAVSGNSACANTTPYKRKFVNLCMQYAVYFVKLFVYFPIRLFRVPATVASSFALFSFISLFAFAFLQSLIHLQIAKTIPNALSFIRKFFGICMDAQRSSAS